MPGSLHVHVYHKHIPHTYPCNIFQWHQWWHLSWTWIFNLIKARYISPLFNLDSAQVAHRLGLELSKGFLTSSPLIVALGWYGLWADKWGSQPECLHVASLMLLNFVTLWQMHSMSKCLKIDGASLKLHDFVWLNIINYIITSIKFCFFNAFTSSQPIASRRQVDYTSWRV